MALKNESFLYFPDISRIVCTWKEHTHMLIYSQLTLLGYVNVKKMICHLYKLALLPSYLASACTWAESTLYFLSFTHSIGYIYLQHTDLSVQMVLWSFRTILPVDFTTPRKGFRLILLLLQSFKCCFISSQIS